MYYTTDKKWWDTWWI